MKAIPFAQFLMPNGKRRDETISLEDDCFERYQQIVSCGCRLTAEILGTGQVSFCIEHPEGDFDCVISTNGPEVPVAISAMLRNFNTKRFDEWLRIKN